MFKASAGLTIRDEIVIGLDRHYNPTPIVTLNLALCQNGLQTRNWFTQLIGLYYLKDQQGQGISVFKQLYDPTLFREIATRIQAQR